MVDWGRAGGRVRLLASETLVSENLASENLASETLASENLASEARASEDLANLPGEAQKEAQAIRSASQSNDRR
jgi:hypothetical protein